MAFIAHSPDIGAALIAIVFLIMVLSLTLSPFSLFPQAQGRTLAQSIVVVAIQLGYTCLFGAYAALLHLKLKSLFAAIAAHALCNSLGLPTIGAKVEVYTDNASITRTATIMDKISTFLHIIGFVGYIGGIIYLIIG